MYTACVQLDISDGSGKDDRFEAVDRIFTEMLHEVRQLDMILLPELWGVGFFDFDNYARESEPLLGKTFQFLSGWAKRLQSCILGGSIVEADGGKLYNTALLISSDGELMAPYRKVHLFGYRSKEPRILTAGDEAIFYDAASVNFGLATCYDLRFPEQFMWLAEMRTDLFLVPAAWPAPRIEQWRVLNRARAIENQAWFASCNAAGFHKGSHYGGHSMIVSPEGEIVSEASDEPGIIYGYCDLEALREYRRSFPVLKDRFPER